MKVLASYGRHQKAVSWLWFMAVHIPLFGITIIHHILGKTSICLITITLQQSIARAINNRLIFQKGLLFIGRGEQHIACFMARVYHSVLMLLFLVLSCSCPGKCCNSLPTARPRPHSPPHAPVSPLSLPSPASIRVMRHVLFQYLQ